MTGGCASCKTKVYPLNVRVTLRGQWFLYTRKFNLTYFPVYAKILRLTELFEKKNNLGSHFTNDVEMSSCGC